jgi:hypothetical protein
MKTEGDITTPTIQRLALRPTDNSAGGTGFDAATNVFNDPGNRIVAQSLSHVRCSATPVFTGMLVRAEERREYAADSSSRPEARGCSASLGRATNPARRCGTKSLVLRMEPGTREQR